MQVWVCLLEPELPVQCGGQGGILQPDLSSNFSASSSMDLACYVYNEKAQSLVYWGPNSILALVPNSDIYNSSDA